jgi:hypothetical protein
VIYQAERRADDALWRHLDKHPRAVATVAPQRPSEWAAAAALQKVRELGTGTSYTAFLGPAGRWIARHQSIAQKRALTSIYAAGLGRREAASLRAPRGVATASLRGSVEGGQEDEGEPRQDLRRGGSRRGLGCGVASLAPCRCVDGRQTGPQHPRSGETFRGISPTARQRLLRRPRTAPRTPCVPPSWSHCRSAPAWSAAWPPRCGRL